MMDPVLGHSITHSPPNTGHTLGSALAAAGLGGSTFVLRTDRTGSVMRPPGQGLQDQDKPEPGSQLPLQSSLPAQWARSRAEGCPGRPAMP